MDSEVGLYEAEWFQHSGRKSSDKTDHKTSQHTDESHGQPSDMRSMCVFLTITFHTIPLLLLSSLQFQKVHCHPDLFPTNTCRTEYVSSRKQEAQLLLGDRATRKHAKDS